MARAVEPGAEGAREGDCRGGVGRGGGRSRDEEVVDGDVFCDGGGDGDLVGGELDDSGGDGDGVFGGRKLPCHRPCSSQRK